MRKTLARYSLLPIDTTSNTRDDATRTIFEPLGLKPPPAGGALLAVLNADGRPMASADVADLLTMREISPAKLHGFLKAHLPAVPDAEKLLAEGLAQARRDQKHVLIELRGEYRAECEMLSRYLERHRNELSKDYVHVMLDARFTRGESVIDRLRPTGGNLPWMAILDADGKMLIAGDVEGTSIGYPISPTQVGHWETMIRTTARHLGDAEIRILVDRVKTDSQR